MRKPEIYELVVQAEQEAGVSICKRNTVKASMAEALANHYKAAAEGRADSDDDDVEIDEIQSHPKVPSRCPITMKEMSEPMQSKKCLHHYSKEGIMAFLQKKKSCPCPIGGCSRTVSKRDLVKVVVDDPSSGSSSSSVPIDAIDVDMAGDPESSPILPVVKREVVAAAAVDVDMVDKNALPEASKSARHDSGGTTAGGGGAVTLSCLFLLNVLPIILFLFISCF
jgi:hypothetical protein